MSQAGSFSSPSKCDIATKQKASAERLSSVLSQDLQCSFSHTLVIISEPLVKNTHLWNQADFSCFWDYSVEVRAVSDSWHSVSELETLTAAPGLSFGWEIRLGTQTPQPWVAIQLWGCGCKWSVRIHQHRWALCIPRFLHGKSHLCSWDAIRSGDCIIPHELPFCLGHFPSPV